MKTIVEINSTNYASTGNIMLNIAKEARTSCFCVYTACKDSKESRKHLTENHILIGTRLERTISEELSYFTGLRDHFNLIGTKDFLKKLDEIKPDLIHLHTMHDTFIHTGMLFDYIKKNQIPVVWTFHDTCAFTGQCPYFSSIKCEKWKTECHHCPQTNITPKSFVDSTKYIYNKKKEWISNVDSLTVVTPSKWLAELSKESIFKNYSIRVINNGIDLDIFSPKKSDFRKIHHLEDKYLLLGVANRWSTQKGLDVFCRLANDLEKNYQIVLVGTNDEIDKNLPKNILSIHRTYDQNELAEIYSACDLFVNPTREENFPTVNIESLACGTPVLTYQTGGSPEIIDDSCGRSVIKDDYNSLLSNIKDICMNKPYQKEACVKRASQFDMKDKFQEYVDLYKEILKPSI